MTQIAISLTVNALIVLTAGAVSAFLARRPFSALVQRWLIGTVLAALAVRMAIDTSRR
jgi:threonine/homoserine/homoserine lactone efflux protein